MPNPKRVAAGKRNRAKRKGLTPEGRERLRRATNAETIMRREFDEKVAAAEEFVTVLPTVLTYLTSVFRFVRCQQTRDDVIAEGVGLCWKWFVRARQRGKNPAEFPTALAKFAARAVRAGRTVCGSQRSKEVLSAVARHRHGVVVEYFGRGSGRCPRCCVRARRITLLVTERE